MPTTALAPHFLGGGKIELTTHSYRDPGPGELLLGVEADAVCGTDREQYFEGSACVPGHEGPRWEIARAFELFLSGETGKVVVVEDET